MATNLGPIHSERRSTEARPAQAPDALKKDVARRTSTEGSQRLIELVAASDGLQLTADRRRNIRHFANTMFNIMRGGIFDENYTIERADFTAYIDRANHKVFFKKSELMGKGGPRSSTWPSCKPRLARTTTLTLSACAQSTCL